MSLRVNAEIEGLDELVAKLRSLPAKISKKHLRKAVNETSKGVLKSTKAKVAKRTGLLRKSLGRKVKVYPSGVVVAVVGARKGYREMVGTRTRGKNKGAPVYVNPVKYLHLVELGTVRSQAKRMLRDALADNTAAFRNAVITAANNALAEVAI